MYHYAFFKVNYNGLYLFESLVQFPSPIYTWKNK